MKRSVPILAITVLALTASALAWGEDGGGTVKGCATTTVAGGTGAPSYVPVITKLTFHWRDGQGRFARLAVAPSAVDRRPRRGTFEMRAPRSAGPAAGCVLVAAAAGGEVVPPPEQGRLRSRWGAAGKGRGLTVSAGAARGGATRP